MHAVLADSAFLMGHSLRKLRRLAIPRPGRGDPPHMVSDYLRNGVLARGASLAPERTN
jgi:hypothetical protein